MPRTAYVILTIELFEEEGQWVGYCRELGTSICADTMEQARDDINDAILLHLNTLEDVGERSRFFKNHGIKLHRGTEEVTRCRPRVQLNKFVTCQTVPIGA